MAAAVVLLAAAVLLHFGTPHHSAVMPNVVSAMAPAVEAESRKQDAASAPQFLGTGAQHHEAGAEALILPPRTGHPAEPPSLSADTTVDEAVSSLAAVSGPAHPRTARDAFNPGAGIAPDAIALQIFRC
ncbi:hypothetical protein ACIP8U_41225 [Streptomyces pseudovenezuelae]|uniref:hypothetical protein n=1 Tax=Streptomyces pseudovenezuelae TaxID=67350 RepID=UPI0036DFCFE0